MATSPPAPPAPGAPPPPPPPKKSRTMAFVLGAVGGCLTLIIICAVGIYFFIAHKAKQAGLDTDLIKRNPAMAAAKLAVAANPDVDLVSTDEAKSEMTVHDKKTGKTYTISFDDAKNGKFTMKEEGGKAGAVTFGGKAKLPSWVPDYPGSNTQGAFSATGPDGESGTFTFKTTDSSDKVIKFYQDQFQASGLKVTSNVTSQSGSSSAGMLVGEDQANKHTVTVVLGVEGSETTVGVTYATNK